MDNINTILPAVRWGILGCGDVTERKVVPHIKTEGFEVSAVMRRDAEKRLTMPIDTVLKNISQMLMR
jgi:predicted dehydrogenase